jgi:hypothetical protein
MENDDSKENPMLRRSLTLALLFVAASGLAFAETYRGLIIDLTNSKLTILAPKPGERKAEKKMLDVAARVLVSQARGKGEKEIPFVALQKLVGGSEKSVVGKGIPATIITDGAGRVDAIRLGKGGLPEKAAAILEKAERIELYSLEPEPDPKVTKDPKTTHFRGWMVLGKTVVKQAAARKSVTDAIDLSVGRGQVAKCFEPRHGVRATDGDKTVDLVICFRCGQVYCYYDPKKDEYTQISIHKGMQPSFDEILKTAGIPLATPAKE